MNILPHKSWHVRTKKNIARVKKDQAQAAEEEKEKQRRIALAAQEARTTFLRERAGLRHTGSVPAENERDQIDPALSENSDGMATSGTAAAIAPFALSKEPTLTREDGHINFFQDIEDGKQMESGVNADHELEKKNEKEDYEKKIGLLVYLGQDSLEHSKDRPWYANLERDTEKVPGNISKQSSATTAVTKEKDLKVAKLKDFQDPLKDIRMYLSSPGMTKKMSTGNSSSKTVSLKRKIEFTAEGASSQATTTPSTSNSKEKKKKKKSKKSHIHRHSHKSKSKKHHKKHKRSHLESEDGSTGSGTDSEEEKKKSIEKLRAERLQREREEKRRAEKLLAGLRGEVVPEPEESAFLHTSSRLPVGDIGRKQKYNSQFNPHIARQNFVD